jgi:hypothetical protein
MKFIPERDGRNASTRLSPFRLFGKEWKVNELSNESFEEWAHLYADTILLKLHKSALERGRDITEPEMKVLHQFVRVI